MKILLIILFILSLVISEGPKYFYDWPDTVIVTKFYVPKYDNTFNGDAFVADIEGYPPIVGREIKILVNGMRCPDMLFDKVQAERSKNWLLKYLVQADTIRLANMERGGNFEIVADVLIDNHLLRTYMFYFTKCDSEVGRDY